MERAITIKHSGVTYYGHPARITSTRLGSEDHGIFTAWLTVEAPGWGTSVGGYALDRPNPVGDSNREGTAYGLDQLMKLLWVVGVDRWELLPGREVVVLYDTGIPLGQIAKGLVHSIEDRVLILAEHAKAWREDD